MKKKLFDELCDHYSVIFVNLGHHNWVHLHQALQIQFLKVGFVGNRRNFFNNFQVDFIASQGDNSMGTDAYILLVIVTLTVIVTRVLYVIWRSSKPLRNTSSPQHLSTLIVLGSGGHTAEMLNLLSVLQIEIFTPRFYIAAATDNMSLQKARSFEDSFVDKAGFTSAESRQFLQIYRSREVGQSYITSIGTTLIAIAHALWLMVKIRPQVILCNGPGTCIPLCVIAFLFKVFGVRWSSIFYVESIARVKRLSLSGLLLYKLRMADQLFVQWPQLQRKYPRAHFVGRLM